MAGGRDHHWTARLRKYSFQPFILLFLSLTVCPAADPSGLWPRYRHDGGLTGFSPLKGGLGEAPKILWTVDLWPHPRHDPLLLSRRGGLGRRWQAGIHYR